MGHTLHAFQPWVLIINIKCEFCLKGLDRTLIISTFEIFNTDQGNQVMGSKLTSLLEYRDFSISIVGHNKVFGNILIGGLRRTIKSLWQWCKENRHLPLDEQYRMLCLKLRGHYQYYGVRSNYRQLEEVHQQVMKGWRYWLNRRDNQRKMIGEKFKEILTIFPLPKPRIIHAI